MFLEEHAALAYREHVSENPIVLDGLRIKATLLTPTWPLKPAFRKNIFDHEMTRCLVVFNLPRILSAKKLKEDLQLCRNIIMTWVTHLHMSQEGVLKIHFSSVIQASRAHQMFSSGKFYAGCTPYFVPDPCAQPLETLDRPESTLPRYLWDRHEDARGEKRNKEAENEVSRLHNMG